MTTNAAVTVLAAAALLAGCQGSTDPSDPPTSQDALTTTDDVAPTTGDAAPTTQPPDDVQETSSAPSDTVETTDAGGPPPMPEEATEDSEAGAEAFALHYVDLLNYSAMTPAEGLIDPLASDDCATCEGFEEMMATYSDSKQHAAGPIVTVDGTRAAANGLTTTVFLDAIQTVPATLEEGGGEATAAGSPTDFTMVMTVKRDGGEWKVSGIQVQQ